jgi:AcrR family transcriptional regulator
MASPTPPATPHHALRADAERNRQLILETARRAFAERGLGVRLDEIAQEAGIGIGTVYRRFKNKDELVHALFEHAMDEVVELADECLAQDAEGTGLRRFFEGALRLMASDRGLRQLLTGIPNASVELATLGRRRIEPRVTRLAANAHAAGRLRCDLGADDLPVVQLMLTAAMEATEPVQPDMWERYATLVLDALEPGLDNRPLPGRQPTGDEVQVVIERWRSQPRAPGARS